MVDPIIKQQLQKSPQALQENVNHISMSMMERLRFRVGLLSKDALQSDISNQIKRNTYPMTLVTPITGKPVLANANDLHPSMALSLLTGAIGHPFYLLACRLIKPYDTVLEVGGTHLDLAFHTALKTSPVGYHYSGDLDNANSPKIKKIAELNHLHFKVLPDENEATEDIFNQIQMRLYTVILINRLETAFRLAGATIPLALRHIIIKTNEMTPEVRQDLLHQFEINNFVKQTENEDAIHVMRIRKQ